MRPANPWTAGWLCCADGRRDISGKIEENAATRVKACRHEDKSSFFHHLRPFGPLDARLNFVEPDRHEACHTSGLVRLGEPRRAG